MKIAKNILLHDQHLKPITTDIFFKESTLPKPVVIYAHGFNGFKDWGNFDLIAEQFAEAGFVFIKFNFAFNGTTPDQPEVFADLDAYAENNYTKELDNLEAVIDWAVSQDNPYHKQIDSHLIYLLGHSRGGGIVLLKAAEDARVKAVITWASVSQCKTPWGSWPEEKMAQWKKEGVAYIANSRTHQQMPLHYQLYEDFQQHKDRLDIEQAIKKLNIPILICHGENDPSVSVKNAYQLSDWNPAAQLFILDGDHVFGRKHPWTEITLPEAMQKVMDRSMIFFNDITSG